MNAFGDAFLDDYFAECQEHLTAIRQALLALDASVGRPRPDSRVIEELFRGYHSLKGLAGMVEDRPGESLAHEMESYLRTIRDGETPLTTKGVETLIDGTSLLEQIIGSRRRRDAAPAHESMVAALRQVAAVRTAEGGQPTERQRQSVDAGATECVFTPSAALSARGVNVDSVRARLREHGEILGAAPMVSDRGAVAFRFVVDGPIDEALASAWAADGLVVSTASSSSRSGAAASDAAGQVTPVDRPPEGLPLTAGHYVRVDLGRLDDLMRMIGDMVILRARLADALGRIESRLAAHEWRPIHEHASAIERQLRELRDGVMRVRLVAVGEIFRRMPFVVRDLARESDRRVTVTLDGQETQIDKYLVERMMDPILHLVRNAVSHGLEPLDERLAAGKPPEGTVSLRAWASGETVTLEIGDDGRGVDAARVLARAAAAGLPVPAAPDVSAATLLDLICSPGFSTRDEIDHASGRGFGMAVVRKTVEELGGALQMTVTPGHGTRFTIELPLTLAITDALIAAVGDQTFAVPQSAVREVIEIDEAEVGTLEGGEVVPVRGAALPLLRLSAVLAIAVRPQPRRHAFIIGTGVDSVGLIVDRVLSQREIVVRTTTDPFIRVHGISGATDLGDGRAVLILDAASLAQAGRGQKRLPRLVREIA